MAIINCPECSANISDKAKTCIHCGCPIEDTRADGTVTIKLPPAETMLFTKAYITDELGHELWSGKLGSVVNLYLSQKTKIIINCGKLTTPLEVEVDPKGNPRFSMMLEPGIHWYAHYILNRVDIIDSE